MSDEERRDAITVEVTALVPLVDARANAQPRAQCEMLVGDYFASTQDLFDRWPVLSYDDLQQRLGDVLVAQEALGRRMDTFELETPGNTVTCLRAAQLVNGALQEAAQRVKDWDLLILASELLGRANTRTTPPKLFDSTQATMDSAAKKLNSLGHPLHKGPWSMTLPRTQAEVEASIFGGLLDEVCRTEIREVTELAEPCGAVEETVTNGVTEDEESDLLDALRTLNDAREEGSLAG